MNSIRKQWNKLVGNDRPPRVANFPPSISYFLGYRGSKQTKFGMETAPEWARLVQVLLVTFGALIVQAVINRYGYPFKGWGTPVLVPSFGASAVLTFNAMAAPLAQPRNLIMGTMIASFVGVVLLKLWLLGDNEQYLWLGAPLSCGMSSVILSIFKCVHPPAGAAAMLPLIDEQVRQLGWKYLVVQLVGCAVFLAFACLFDNVCARYPVYWWNPPPAAPKEPYIEISQEMVTTSAVTDERFYELVTELQGYLAGSGERAARTSE